MDKAETKEHSPFLGVEVLGQELGYAPDHSVITEQYIRAIG